MVIVIWSGAGGGSGTTKPVIVDELCNGPLYEWSESEAAVCCLVALGDNEQFVPLVIGRSGRRSSCTAGS